MNMIRTYFSPYAPVIFVSTYMGDPQFYGD